MRCLSLPAVAPQKVLPRQQAGQFDILNATGALVARLTPTGEVLDVAGNIREVLGVPAEILLGTGLFERIRVSDRVGFLCAVNDVRRGSQKGMSPLLIRVAKKDDTDAPAHSLFDMELVADIERHWRYIRDPAPQRRGRATARPTRRR